VTIYAVYCLLYERRDVGTLAERRKRGERLEVEAGRSRGTTKYGEGV